MRVYVGLLMLAGCTKSRFLAFYWFGTFLRVSALAPRWLEDWQIVRHLVQYEQQANPLLSMQNYAPLVISGNDKNKQLALLSQCKLAYTGRNMLMPLQIRKNILKK
jgi:hypothetical protein